MRSHGAHSTSFCAYTPPLVTCAASWLWSRDGRGFGVVQRRLSDVVVADLHAERVLHGVSPPRGETPLSHFHAGDEPVVDLLLLVAVDRVVEEET